MPLIRASHPRERPSRSPRTRPRRRTQRQTPVREPGARDRASRRQTPQPAPLGAATREDTSSDAHGTTRPQAHPPRSRTTLASPFNQQDPPQPQPRRMTRFLPSSPMIRTRSQRLSAFAHANAYRRKRLSPETPVALTAKAVAFAGGGGDRDRTDDLLLAKQALSRLSYTPGGCIAATAPTGASQMRRKGIQQLLHSPLGVAAQRLPARRLRRKRRWWAREDLNLRPHAYQARALTS